MDEGTVQTTNSKEAAKVEVVSITGWSQVRSLPSPPYDNDRERTGRGRETGVSRGGRE
ncbi:MAG: hypothetical protein WC451_00230 [Patescibacteria group bacterium]